MNYPALLKSFSGTIYHITDDGCKTRCGRRIDALSETHALALEDKERCSKCGTAKEYDAISDTRAAEEVAQHQAHLDKLAEIAATHAARSAVRPLLVDEIKGLLNNLSWRGDVKNTAHLNLNELRVPVTYEDQAFTIKIQIWNGDHE
jgi:hypothetical protein